MSLEFLQNNKKENKTESLEEQLEKAREDGRILNKKLQEGGGLSRDDPYAYREKEYISENDISAFQLDALLHEPLKDKDGNPVLSIEGKTLSAKEVLEQEQFRKTFVKEMANDARRAINNGGSANAANAWWFLTASDAYNQTFSSEQKKDIDKLFKEAMEKENMEQKSIEEVLSNNVFQKALVKDMANDARRAINNGSGGNAWYACDFLIASDAYNQTFSSEQKEDIDKLFKTEMGQSIEEVLFNNVFQKVLVKRMAHNARVVINKEYGYDARYFLTASDAYNQTFSSEQKKDIDELFKTEMEQKSIKEVLSNNVFQKVLVKNMTHNAREAINNGNGYNVWRFLTTFKSVNALISFYHKEASKDRAEKELSSNKKEKLPPMFPQRNF